MWELPADMATAFPPTVTVVGLLDEAVDPMPSCPLSLEPQHFRAQLSVIAHVWLPPVETASTFSPIVTDTGVLLSVFVPSPS